MCLYAFEDLGPFKMVTNIKLLLPSLDLRMKNKHSESKHVSPNIYHAKFHLVFYAYDVRVVYKFLFCIIVAFCKGKMA